VERKIGDNLCFAAPDVSPPLGSGGANHFFLLLPKCHRGLYLLSAPRHTRAMEDANWTECPLARNNTSYNKGQGGIRYEYPPEFVYPMASLLILVSTKCTKRR